MRTSGIRVGFVVVLTAGLLAGCAAPEIDFSTIQRPDRAPELDAYEIFVGSWDWQAEVLNAEGEDRNWSGQADWAWTLDKRCLQGKMSAKSKSAAFEAEGIWSWHPKEKKYKWWMFNNWGYPQAGTARYDARSKSWKMKYTSVGLDGTTSYGTYEMEAVNKDTLKWRMVESADMMGMFKKMEMIGTYKRRG